MYGIFIHVKIYAKSFTKIYRPAPAGPLFKLYESQSGRDSERSSSSPSREPPGLASSLVVRTLHMPSQMFRPPISSQHHLCPQPRNAAVRGPPASPIIFFGGAI